MRKRSKQHATLKKQRGTSCTSVTIMLIYGVVIPLTIVVLRHSPVLCCLDSLPVLLWYPKIPHLWNQRLGWQRGQLSPPGLDSQIGSTVKARPSLLQKTSKVKLNIRIRLIYLRMILFPPGSAFQHRPLKLVKVVVLAFSCQNYSK